MRLVGQRKAHGLRARKACSAHTPRRCFVKTRYDAQFCLCVLQSATQSQSRHTTGSCFLVVHHPNSLETMPRRIAVSRPNSRFSTMMLISQAAQHHRRAHACYHSHLRHKPSLRIPPHLAIDTSQHIARRLNPPVHYSRASLMRTLAMLTSWPLSTNGETQPGITRSMSRC